ncbi:COG3415 family protein [Spirosoma gilvum]
MGRATEMGLRDQLIALKQQGATLVQIAQQLNLPVGTVRKLSANYHQHQHLGVAYAYCGPKQPTSEALMLRASLWLKKHHPRWGAPLIHLKLTQRYGQQRTPSIRTLQRWSVTHQLTKPPNQLQQTRIGTAKAVHNIWQVDAKENLTLPDGSVGCYLTITDEHSGAGLAA